MKTSDFVFCVLKLNVYYGMGLKRAAGVKGYICQIYLVLSSKNKKHIESQYFNMTLSTLE